MIHILWWHWILIVYFGLGFMVCVFATGEMLADALNIDNFPHNDDFRWWHVPRAYAFCFFIGPAYLFYFSCKFTIEDRAEKRNKKQEPNFYVIKKDEHASS